MKILFLTWKDLRHPNRGGAEVVMHRYASRLVALGHEVVWFASAFSGCESESEYDGIRVVRRYGKSTGWLFSRFWYREFVKKEGGFDVILDEAGGIPLLAWTFERKTPIVFFVHHIGDKEWDHALPWPFSQIAKGIFFRMVASYKRFPTVVVSESTKTELVEHFGFDAKLTQVVENTVDEAGTQVSSGTEHKENWIVFVGRLMPIKRVEDAIRSFYEFHTAVPGYVLKIIGNQQDAEYVKMLRRLVKKLDIENLVEFLGEVPKDQKNEIVRRSKACLVPSKKEGFGLVVLESNVLGTTVVGYNVPWLKDSIRDGKNGRLVDDGDFVSMGKRLVELVGNDAYFDEFVRNAAEHIGELPTWDEQAQKFESVLLSAKRPC